MMMLLGEQPPDDDRHVSLKAVDSTHDLPNQTCLRRHTWLARIHCRMNNSITRCINLTTKFIINGCQFQSRFTQYIIVEKTSSRILCHKIIFKMPSVNSPIGESRWLNNQAYELEYHSQIQILSIINLIIICICLWQSLNGPLIPPIHLNLWGH